MDPTKSPVYMHFGMRIESLVTTFA